jgi:hypothetical protein
MYLRRLRAVGRSFAAALTHVLTVVMPLCLRQRHKTSKWTSGGLPEAGVKQKKNK